MKKLPDLDLSEVPEVPEALEAPEIFALHLGTSTVEESLGLASEARWLGRHIALNL
ncbi:hypothetical protein QUA82_07950 [Microcoleus sp. F8-D3]